MTGAVCILTETYHPVVGGGETQARALGEGLAAGGWEVAILTRRSHAALKKVEQYDGLTVHRLRPVGSQHTRKWGLIFSALAQLWTLRRQYDLIFVSGFRILGIPAVMAAKLLGKPCVLKADSPGEMSGAFFTAGLRRIGLGRQSPLFRLFLAARNWLLCRANAFVAISGELEQELLAEEVDVSRIQRIPNGVDTRRFRPVSAGEKSQLRQRLGLPSQGRIAVFSGRLVSYKGLPLLVSVWPDVCRRHPDACLVLVGSGGLDMHNCESELRSFVAAHGLEGQVRFAGEVAEVQPYLQAADIFVFPTEREAFGLALVEAMACGLPCVATTVGGLQDIVVDGQNALAVEAGNGQQLCAALSRLLAEPQLAARLGRAARVTVGERYDLEQVVADYAALFRRLTLTGDRPAAA